VVTKNLRVRATFLWDASVAGTWEVLRAEAEALVRFAADDATSFAVQITPG
jgi:hypothetical protein